MLALSGALCDKNPPAPKSDAQDADVMEAGDPTQVYLSNLAEPAQKELQAVFSDEFCYCGCPHTLGACLKEHPDCKHAKRMALLATGEASAGVPSTEIIVLLSKYYLSFRERVKLTPDSRMCLGPTDAKVTLVEFSDFECPFCAAAAPLLEDFQKMNPDVRFCFQPFPLQNHPMALPAAQAALFARDQGSFWPMHDALFANQMSLSREKIVQLGVSIGLSAAELAKAIDSGQYLDELAQSKDLGRKVKVDHTPMIFVNGRSYLLGLSSEDLKHTVEDELEWQANGNAWAKD